MPYSDIDRQREAQAAYARKKYHANPQKARESMREYRRIRYRDEPAYRERLLETNRVNRKHPRAEIIPDFRPRRSKYGYTILAEGGLRA